MLNSDPITRSEIESLIPHAGGMCLLDQVDDWDDNAIHCRGLRHRDSDHVLRRAGQLSALHLIEYGAQAMAIHGGLIARAEGKGVQPGFLALVRKASFSVQLLDEIQDDLCISATRLAGGEQGWTYDFQVSAGQQPLAEGRVAVMFQPEAA